MTVTTATSPVDEQAELEAIGAARADVDRLRRDYDEACAATCQATARYAVQLHTVGRVPAVDRARAYQAEIGVDLQAALVAFNTLCRARSDRLHQATLEANAARHRDRQAARKAAAQTALRQQVLPAPSALGTIAQIPDRIKAQIAKWTAEEGGATS